MLKKLQNIHIGFALMALLGLSAEVHAQASDVNCNGCVGTRDIANESITSADIKNKSVAQRKLGSWAVSTSKIKPGAVTTSKIRNRAVTAAKVAPELINAINDNAADIAAHEPVEITVNCAAGDTVTTALESVAVTTPVTITIVGTCAESVFIRRDHVTLIGSTSADGIAASGGGPAVFAFEASYISLESLTLNGGGFGLGCLEGGVVNASDVTVLGGTVAGVFASEGGVCDITNSTIDGSNIGVLSVLNSHVSVVSSVIENSTSFGVNISSNSTIDVTATLFPPGAPSVLRNNAAGGIVSLNSTINLSNAIVELSAGSGLAFQAGGALFVNLGDTAIIRNNGGDGLRFAPNSSALFFSAAFEISNNGGFGVNCDVGDNGAPRGNVSINGVVSSIFGNASGPLSGNCDGVP